MGEERVHGAQVARLGVPAQPQVARPAKAGGEVPLLQAPVGDAAEPAPRPLENLCFSNFSACAPVFFAILVILHTCIFRDARCASERERSERERSASASEKSRKMAKIAKKREKIAKKSRKIAKIAKNR